MLKEQFIRSFTNAALSPDPDLAVAALMIARIEYPRLEAGPYLDELDAIGREARLRVESAPSTPDAPMHVDPERYASVRALNSYLFSELRFVGNETHYEDPRNSFLNEVLDRRTGIPITLALLYIEIARRAGLQVEGVNFPGHFLLRCRARFGLTHAEDLIIDAFHGGAIVSEDGCRQLLRRYAGDEAVLGAEVMAHATKPQILSRMLMNLKRTYVRMYSFPQARDITELMLALNPSALTELKDRGLLAYHLNDLSSALRDLQAYLKLSGGLRSEDTDREEHAQIWEHVKTLQKRLASLN
jgi:regulator of sirC expression with transglutaminase-like and TPR domain